MAKTIRTRIKREILEASERKRARTEEKQQRKLREIAIVKQKVQGVRVRLFKWDESLLRDKFSDWGVVVSQVKNFDEDCGVAENEGEMLGQRVGLFELKVLQRGWEDEMRSLVIMSLKEQEVLAEEDMVGDLAAEVVSYISSNFRFPRQSLSSRTRRIVVFIEVDMVTTREYCVMEDGEEEQPFVDFDDMLEDYYVGADKEEQEYGQLEGRSTEFGTEETRGEEEDDDDDDEEEEEEGGGGGGYYEDFDMSEDNYVGLDAQETVEDEDEEEVDNLTTRDFFITEDSETCQSGGREEDGDHEEDNIEEANGHRLDQQPLENIDQSENYYEWSPSDDEYGYEYQPSDDEYGYEDQPFSTLADTYVVTDGIREIGGEEEDEESFVDFYQFEDTPPVDPEEIGEEDEGSSEPELAEIEDILWRFIKLEKFSRVDPDRSRDCRGLKQVKEAMEIIKNEICSKDKETDPCSLCLEGLAEGEEEVARTRCSHLFHRKCLCLWLSIKDSCPLCRSRCATVV